MGKRRPAWMVCLFAVLAVAASIGFYCYARSIEEREAVADSSYFVDENGKIEIPPGENTTEARLRRGESAENPFFGLEIVPYEGYAELGYLIEGCEPIDFSVYSNRGNLPYYHREAVIYSLDDIPRLLPDYEIGKEVRDANAEQFGIMTRVADGTGTYRQIPVQCEYTTGGEGGYALAAQYSSGQIDANGETVYYGDTTGSFVTFRYDAEAAGVMKYSPVVNTRLGEGYYRYYSMVDGHWVYQSQGSNVYTPDFYIGTGTHYVVFIPDEAGEYVVDQVLGTASEGIFKIVLDANRSMEWGALASGSRQTALYKETAGYLATPGGSYTRKILKARYEKVETGRPGADFTYAPLSYQEAQELSEIEKNTYRNALPEGTSFKVSRKNIAYYTGYVHDNTFLKETLDLGYDMIDGVRTPVTDEAKVEERIAKFHSIVYTVTPEDLNQNLDLIDRADIISISAMNKVGSTIEMYRECRREELFSRADTPLAKAVKNYYNSDSDKATFSTNQLDWDAVMRLYNRVTKEEYSCPIIFDTVAYKSVGTSGNVANQKTSVEVLQTYANGMTSKQGGDGFSNNLYKLFLLLGQMRPEVFISLYGDMPDVQSGELISENFRVVETDETDKDGSKIRTCLFTKWNLPESAPQVQKDAMKYWNEYTFLPYELIPAQGQHKEVLNSLAIMNSYNDTIYQYDSGPAQNMLRGSLYVFPTNNLMTIEFRNLGAAGLNDDQYGWEAYDYFDSVSGEMAGMIEQLGTARSLHYIYIRARREAEESLEDGEDPTEVKTYRVLELEPSSLYYKTDVAWAAFIANHAGEAVTALVDRMTTAEFNGKHMDLISEYDLIYIGVNKDTMDVTMQFDGGTQYIYAHTGPRTNVDNASLHGLLGQASIENQFVFSGNDLSEQAMEQLFAYAKQGFPIMFGTGYYTGADAAQAVGGIDRSSNVYALSSAMKASTQTAKVHLYEGAFSGDISYYHEETTKFTEALANGRTKLTVFDKPVEYDSSKTQYSQKYITSGVLRYRFKVNANSAHEFEVKLLLDKNRDGIFTPEEQVETELYPIDESGVQGTRIDDNRISGSTTYLVKSPLTGINGGVYWKLAIEKNGEVYASLTGVSAVREGSRKDIYVLQVVPNTTSSCMVYLPQDGEVVGSTVQIPGLTDAQKQTTRKIWEYADALTEYKLHFVRKTEQEVAALQTENTNGLSGQYDMIVLGLTDAYGEMNSAVIQEAAERFLSGGKSVVYLPSTFVLPGNDAVNGSYAKKFRNRFGADRYGITGLDTAGRAAELLAAYTSGLLGDVPKEPSTSGAGNYVTVNAGGTNYLLAQGISNAVLYRYKASMATDVTTKKLNKINCGLLTEYPYTCGEELIVSDTDAPYYQLDMEKENLSVWFTLAGDTSGTVSDIYLKRSENDTRNHYHTYSLGNVVYSGIGTGESLTEDEMKLLINTFAGAYREAPETARVLVTNVDAAKEGDSYYLCVDIDSAQKDKLMGSDCRSSYFVWEAGYVVEKPGESKRLSFRIKDDNMVPTGSTAEYTLLFETESAGVYTETEYVVYDAAGNPVEHLQANTEYYTFVKVKTESTSSGPAIGQTKLRIKAELRYFEGITEIFFCEDTKQVQIVPRGLFDLD